VRDNYHPEMTPEVISNPDGNSGLFLQRSDHFRPRVLSMDIHRAIADLRKERELIDLAIAALESLDEHRRPDRTPQPDKAPSQKDVDLNRTYTTGRH